MNAAAASAPRAPVVVEPLRGEDAAWDAFVEAAPSATVFHLTAWRRTLETSFGYRSCSLVARRDGVITGVLPLFELGSKRRPRCLLSSPFAVDGGACASDEESERALALAAVDLMHERGAERLELRAGVDVPGFHSIEGRNFRFRRTIFPSDEENLRAMRSKQRSMVRIGQRSDLTAHFDEDDIEVFHDLFAHSMRRLGTPVFPVHYLRTLRRELGSRCLLVIVRRTGVPVAGALSFVFGRTIAPYYVGALREHFRYAINDFMYWELMKHGRELGLTEFDFGRSRAGTGALEFKRHWGFTPMPMRYSVCTASGQPPQQDDGSTAMSAARRVWSHLPLALTRRLGPTLIKRLGVYHT